MKKLITAILIWSFLTWGPFGERQAQAQTAIVAFVMVVVAAGAIATIYVCHNGEPKLRWYVLEKGYLDGTWTPVCTNYTRGGAGSEPWPVFEVYMTDSLASYRLKEIGQPPPKFIPVYVPGAKENPVLSK